MTENFNLALLSFTSHTGVLVLRTRSTNMNYQKQQQQQQLVKKV